MNDHGFICPLCGGPLMQLGNVLRCAKGHSFDFAKEGYIHLLPVQNKRTKAPGDSKEMIDARARFLSEGFYEVFARTLAQLCVEKAKNQSTPLHILDMGCGEGYYSRIVAEELEKNEIAFEIIGLDISKPAIRRAAKLSPAHCRYAVASCFDCPIQDGWADIALNVFSPFAQEETLRVLRSGGLLIYAVPGPQHLFGLKEILYAEPYENPVQLIDYPGFWQETSVDAEDIIQVDGCFVQDLFCMTPYYWKTPRGGAERLASCSSLRTPIQFRFLRFTKKA